MKQGALVVGVLAALASSASAGIKSGTHVHAIGNANAGATVVAASQMQTGFVYAQAGGELRGRVFLHGDVISDAGVRVDAANSFGSGAGVATAVAGGYTVIARAVFTYNASASVTAAAQQSVVLGTVWGTYLVGPVFVTTWTQASGSFAGELGVSLTPIAAAAAANSAVVSTFGNAGVSSGVWFGCVVTSAHAMGFHAVTFNGALAASWCTGICPPGWICVCSDGSLAGGAALAFAPARVLLVLQTASWNALWTLIVADASISGYAVILVS